MQAICVYCGKTFEAQRKTAKYCSKVCGSRHRTGLPRERNCRNCGKVFPVITRADANRQHCSKACAKAHNAKKVAEWKEARPGYMRPYNERRKAKNPGVWREKAKAERLAIIELLGGRCIACGVTNTNWLHVDYIPTTRNTPYRHPRHFKFVSAHQDQFRLLCANHHYELTLTGRIEGTDITQ